MADTEDVAKVLADFVTNKVGYLTDGDQESIKENMECIVIEWYIDIIDVRRFVKRMRFLEDCD